MKNVLVLPLLIFTFSWSASAECEKHLSSPPDIPTFIQQEAEKSLHQQGFNRHSARGYSILIGTMIASAAATTYLSSSLPSNWQFLSHFLAQVSTLGIYVFGAPIWEPVSSAFRKMAFGVKRREQLDSPPAPLSPAFESQWLRTQELYSLNEQMSRNVISQFLILVRQNFHEACRAMNSDDPNYAADQIADAAYRLRLFYRDIDPEDPAVRAAIRTAFTHHTSVDRDFRSTVSLRLQQLDPTFLSPETQKYYARILKSWLDE